MRPVIFDCDGVLVDSEALIADIALAALAELGMTFERGDYLTRYTGIRGTDYFGNLDAEHRRVLGNPLPRDFESRLRQRAREELNTRLCAIDGVHDVVARISVKAVASSTSVEGLHRSLQKVGLHAAFAPHIYSGDQVSRGKPAPDLFLYAAERLGVEAARCIAVEDSINGVRSACAAGMIVIGFTGGGHCATGHDAQLRAAGAKLVAASMPELSVQITSLGRMNP